MKPILIGFILDLPSQTTSGHSILIYIFNKIVIKLLQAFVIETDNSKIHVEVCIKDAK